MQVVKINSRSIIRTEKHIWMGVTLTIILSSISLKYLYSYIIISKLESIIYI